MRCTINFLSRKEDTVNAIQTAPGSEARNDEEISYLLAGRQKGRLNRREFLRLAMLVGGIGAAEALLAACGPVATSVPVAAPAATPTTASVAATVAPELSGQVIHAFTQEAVQFNPLLYVNTGVETAVQMAVFSTLWQINEKGDFFPDLAVEVPSVANGGISADGLVWTVHLRKDVKWHDGQPFTSKDVRFTYDTLLNPNVAVRSKAGVDKMSSLETPDDYTLVMKLTEPYAPFMWVWQSYAIIPEHILSTVPDINLAEFNSKPIGTGPYVFTERVAGDHISFTANPDFHLEAPHIKTRIQKYVPDQTVLFTQFKTGEIDIYGLQGIPPERMEEARKLPDRKVSTGPGPWVEFIYFNLAKPVLKEKVVRQAIYMGIDKESWITDVYYSMAKRTLSYLAPEHWAYNTSLKDPGYDPEKAKQILDEAGWKPGSDGFREKDGARLTFNISTTTGNKAREQAQLLIQQNLKAVGIDVQIQNFPASVVWGEFLTKCQYDSLIVGWDPPFGLDPDYYMRIHSSQNPCEAGVGANYTQYKNPEVDKLLEDGLRETDPAKRKEIYWKVQAILADELPFAPIFAYLNVEGIKAGLLNYKPNPYLADTTWNCYEWTWKA